MSISIKLLYVLVSLLDRLVPAIYYSNNFRHSIFTVKENIYIFGYILDDDVFLKMVTNVRYYDKINLLTYKRYDKWSDNLFFNKLITLLTDLCTFLLQHNCLFFLTHDMRLQMFTLYFSLNIPKTHLYQQIQQPCFTIIN